MTNPRGHVNELGGFLRFLLFLRDESSNLISLGGSRSEWQHEPQVVALWEWTSCACQQESVVVRQAMQMLLVVRKQTRNSSSPKCSPSRNSSHAQDIEARRQRASDENKASWSPQKTGLSECWSECRSSRTELTRTHLMCRDDSKPTLCKANIHHEDRSQRSKGKQAKKKFKGFTTGKRWSGRQ